MEKLQHQRIQIRVDKVAKVQKQLKAWNAQQKRIRKNRKGGTKTADTQLSKRPRQYKMYLELRHKTTHSVIHVIIPLMLPQSACPENGTKMYGRDPIEMP